MARPLATAQSPWARPLSTPFTGVGHVTPAIWVTLVCGPWRRVVSAAAGAISGALDALHLEALQ
jgi:hypothetical protein